MCERRKAAFAAADVVIMQLETPLETVQAAADLADANGALVILNPAPAQPLPDKLLKKISILTPNETEAELLTGIKVTDDASCNRAADVLLRKGVETVIITLGSRGSFVATSDVEATRARLQSEASRHDRRRRHVQRRTGGGLGRGNVDSDAVRFANAAGAISVTRMGAQPSAPTREEIENLLERRKKSAGVNGDAQVREPSLHMQ